MLSSKAFAVPDVLLYTEYFFFVLIHPIYQLCTTAALVLQLRFFRISDPGSHEQTLSPPPLPYGACLHPYHRKGSVFYFLVDSRRVWAYMRHRYNRRRVRHGLPHKQAPLSGTRARGINLTSNTVVVVPRCITIDTPGKGHQEQTVETTPPQRLLFSLFRQIIYFHIPPPYTAVPNNYHGSTNIASDLVGLL